MRWLFLFVLALNLAYIAWQMSLPSPDTYAQVAPLKNVPPIVLLSELQSDESAAPGHAELVQQEPLAETDNAAEQGGGEDEPAEQEPVADTIEAVTADTHAKAADIAKAAGESLPVSAPRQSCYTLGPFRDLDKLRSLTREIKSYVVSADFRGREEKEPTLYWVYIEPEKSRKKAIETGKRLKEKKIKDFYIIREGEKINGLSLGHFRNKAGAYGLAKKVSALGFDVLVEPVFKSYTMYWLDYQLAEDANIPEAILQQYIQSAEKDKISRLQRECDG